MTRLFSIEILFNHCKYLALVSLKEQRHDIHCIIRYVDKRLRYIMPGDRLVFSLQEGLKEPKHLPDELSQSLLECTVAALNAHLVQDNITPIAEIS